MSPKRVQVEKTTADTKTETVEEVEPKVPEGAQELKDEMDEILDEIDGLLEENAQDFVRNFVQKGGE
jgi:prokaryotic ubiquitin-like protein Pup